MQAWEVAFLLAFWLPVLYLLVQWDGELVNKPFFWVGVSWFFWLYHHGAQACGLLFAVVRRLRPSQHAAHASIHARTCSQNTQLPSATSD